MRRTAPGDFDYDRTGTGYTRVRRTDPRIATQVSSALGDARTVLNVGAGAGSYEPTDRDVTAVEPSATMRAQRPAHLTTALDATAEDLPFADDTFDAAMAMITVHQWADLDQGLRELRRVTRNRVVVLTMDPDVLAQFWLVEYAPELIAVECTRMPPISRIAGVLGGTCEVQPVPVAIDCVDGFGEAFYARPEAFLDDDVRRWQSGWGFVDAAATGNAIERLRAALDDGEWDRRHGALRDQPEYASSLRLIVSDSGR